MPSTKLTKVEIAAALKKLPGWAVKTKQLQKKYKFADFAHAFGFMCASACVIERMDHHPEWLNVYNRVEVSLSTHDAGGITAKDVELAKKLDGFAAKMA